MEEQILQMLERIEWLEKLYEQTLANVNNNINLFWAIVAGVLLVSVASLVTTVSGLVSKGIEKGIKKTEELRKEELKKIECEVNDVLSKKTNELSEKIDVFLLHRTEEQEAKTNLMLVKVKEESSRQIAELSRQIDSTMSQKTEDFKDELNKTISAKYDELTKRTNDALSGKADKNILDGEWFSMILQNGFMCVLGSSVQYTKIGSVVYLKGMLEHSDDNILVGIVFATLPVGYRPTQEEFRILPTSNQGFVKLRITVEGKLMLVDNSNHSPNNSVDIGCCFGI